jgi:hypothetical protein
MLLDENLNLLTLQLVSSSSNLKRQLTSSLHFNPPIMQELSSQSNSSSAQFSSPVFMFGYIQFHPI